MQMEEGGSARTQRLADRRGERQGGEIGHPLHSNLHTNLPHFVHARARSTGTRGRERWLHVLEDDFSCPLMCAEPGEARRAYTVCVLLEGLHVDNLLECIEHL